MSIFQAAVLGIIQGLTEFLPISSSGHLIVAPWLFKWPDPGLGFDIALHWGTLAAVVVYFWQDILLLIKGFWHSLFKSTRNLQNNIYQKLAWLLIIASVPAALIGKLFQEKAETSFRNVFWIAITTGLFALVFWWADVVGAKQKNLDRITWLDSLVVGAAQALAIFPGVSRSGSTMGMGLFLGFKRADAARFSFLMSIPIIFGAGVLKFKDFHSGASNPALLVGFLASAIVGFLAIKFLLKYLANHSFKIFVWYRLALAGLILAVYFVRLR